MYECDYKLLRNVILVALAGILSMTTATVFGATRHNPSHIFGFIAATALLGLGIVLLALRAVFRLRRIEE